MICLITASLALKLCGFLYIFILVTSAASAGLGNRNDEKDSGSKFPVIAENPGQYRNSVYIGIISHIGILAISGMLFLAFSSYDRTLAMIGSLFRLGEGLILIFNEVSVLRLLDIAKEYVLTDSSKAGLRMFGDQILLTKNTRFMVGLLFLAIGALTYGILFIQNGAIPSMIAWLGLGAGIISSIGILITFATGFDLIYSIGLVSMMVFEVVFGGWLLIYSS